MKALILNPDQRTATVRNIPTPHPSPTELLIRVSSIALNPVDSLYTFNPLAFSSNRIIGSDFAGEIQSLGAAVPSTRNLKVGTRVAGFLQGACSVNELPGAFAEFVICKWDLVWRVEMKVKMQEACTVSLCGLTAAQALFLRMGLEAPFSWREGGGGAKEVEKVVIGENESRTFSFFIYGASTSVALYAAQLLHQSATSSGQDIKVFGTASPKHFAMLKAAPYSYAGLVDYHDEDWPGKIRSLNYGCDIDYAYDCISEGDTVAKTSSLLCPATGKLAIVRSKEGGAWSTSTAIDSVLRFEPSYGAVWEGLGAEVQYQGINLRASPQARSFAAAFYRWLSDGGKLRPNPVREMPGGLERVVEDGFALLGGGNVMDRNVKRDEDGWMRPLSAEKMVYRIADE